MHIDKEWPFLTAGLHMVFLPISLACLAMLPSVEAPSLSVASQAFPVNTGELLQTNKNKNKEN